MEKRIVVALGGNAILRHREIGTAEEQFSHVMETCGHLLLLVRKGYQIIITHGNGPQVGDILLKNECARGTLPQMPLDICDAESQGMIGYMFQQSMDAVMKQSGIDIPVVTLVTQVIVDASDPAFSNPEKPVGPYYTAMEAAQLKASVTYNMIVEGVLAETGYQSYFDILQTNNLMPGLRQGIELLKRDESRHIAYGIYLISRLVSQDQSLWSVIESRMNELLPLALGVVQESDPYDDDTPRPFAFCV